MKKVWKMCCFSFTSNNSQCANVVNKQIMEISFESKRKVMVVDEDTEAVRSLTDVLQTKGYQVVESDGKELVKNAIATQPDIIILNSIYSGKQEIVKTLRFEKGLENVLFFIYQ